MKGQLMKENTSVNPKEKGITKAGTLKPQPQSKESRPAINPLAGRYLLLTSLASAGLLGLCFFPMAWGWLAWVALVPLFALTRTQVRPRVVYFCAFAGGLALFTPIVSWMTVAHTGMIFLWVLLSIYCSLYFPLAIFLIRKLDRKTFLPLIFSAPLVWVTLDFIRSFLLTGFAWYYLGHTQHIFLPIIQIADLGGVYPITFLVVMVNALVFEWIYLHPGVRRWFAMAELPLTVTTPMKIRLAQTQVVVVLLLATLTYGFWRLSQNDFTQGPTLSLLQGNVDQRIRNEASSGSENSKSAADLQFEEYRTLADMASRNHESIDLIVWPETSFPWLWLDYSKDIPLTKVPRDAREYLISISKLVRGCCKAGKTNMLFGVNTEYILHPKKKPIKFNSALLVKKPGTIESRYDKIHRLPFGEYMPFKEYSFVNYFSPYDFDYSITQGKELTRFKLGDYHFGVLICYEDTDPFLARQYGREQEEGPPVDFLINISNDGWYAGSSEHTEHLAISRFRAVETRRAVARAVNMGISAIIDPNGRVLKPMKIPGSAFGKDKEHQYWEIIHGAQQTNLPVSEWDQFKQSSGILTGTIPVDDRTTLYSHYGDWFAQGCWLILAIGFIWSFRPSKSKGSSTKNATTS